MENNMNDIVKSLVISAAVGGVVAVTNISVLQSEISDVKRQINKLDEKIERVDTRVRTLEIQNAEFKVFIENRDLLARS